MGASCINTKKSHPHPSAPKRQHNVVHPQNYESILSSNEKVFTQTHRSYFTRRYISISTSCQHHLTLKNLKHFFHYLPLGSNTLDKLYQQFKRGSTLLSFQLFLESAENFINQTDRSLAHKIYNLYFQAKVSCSAQIFYQEFNIFFHKVQKKGQEKDFEDKKFQRIQNLQRILNKKRYGDDRDETIQWLKNNINFPVFRKKFLEGGIEADEKQIYHILRTEEMSSLKTNGKFAIISKIWFDKMEDYIVRKYSRHDLRSDLISRKSSFEQKQKKRLKKLDTLAVQSTVMERYNPRYKEAEKCSSEVVEFNSVESGSPGEINNSVLSGNFQWQIKKLIKPHEYVTINLSTYDKLYLCFGGGPRFVRKYSKGYIQQNAFFVKTYRFTFDKEKNEPKLQPQDLQMLSAYEKIESVLKNAIKNEDLVAYHRNCGCEWKEFPFVEYQKIQEVTVDDVFTQTSFLVSLLESDRKFFHQEYIQKGQIQNFPTLGDIFEKSQFHHLKKQEGEKVCVMEVEKCEQQKNDKVVKYISLEEVHPPKQIRLSEFKSKFKPSKNKVINSMRKKNMRGGIQNLGNTCYLNSILQVLIAARLSDDMFEAEKKVSIQIKQLVEKIERKKKTSVFPLAFKSVFEQFFPYFSGNQQHDAHEFLISLLEILERENGMNLKKDFDAEIQIELRCQTCGQRKKQLQEARIISLPLSDYNKKQMKVDFIKDNRDITTLRFEINPDIKGKEWMQLFKKMTGAENIFMCQIDNSEIVRTFPASDLNLTIKQLKISSQDYLVVYEVNPFQSHIPLKQMQYPFYLLKEQGSFKPVKIQGYVSSVNDPEMLLKEDMIDPKVRISDSEGNRDQIFQSHLLTYPNPQFPHKSLIIKVINYDNDYGERIGIPFFIRVLEFQPIKVVRLYLQKILGDNSYDIRIAPKGNLHECYVCSRKFCSGMRCFQKYENQYPVQWHYNKVNFIVRWNSFFEYSSHISREKKIIEDPHNNDPVEMDYLEKALSLLNQPSNIEMNCQQCLKRTLMASFERISQWPNILIVNFSLKQFHLKRFRVLNGQVIKIFTKWKLQMEFYVDRFRYKLKGIILHAGLTINEGHYTAVIDGFKYDNQVVKQCQLETILPEQIYMLFYVKM